MKFITIHLKSVIKSARAPLQLDADIARSGDASVVNLTKIEKYERRCGSVIDIGYPSTGRPFRYGWSWGADSFRDWVRTFGLFDWKCVVGRGAR